MAVTRIKNNQITDSTVNAAAKLQNYSVTSAKIANNLTYNSDLTISGNLTVQGNVTTIDTVNLVVEDPLILLAKEQTGSPALDIGFIGKRGTSDNIAFVWDESADAFVTAFTTSENTNTTITVSAYASLITLDANVTGNLTIGGNVDITGNVSSLTVTGNIEGGNLLTSGVVSATGNVDGGNLRTGGLISATGNATAGNVLTGGVVSATGNVTGGNIVTGGAVSATGNGTFGNISTAGTFEAASLSASGNITGGNLVTSGLVTATGNVTGGNVLTGGLISAAGNATAGNLVTGGVVSATGNVTGGNVITAGAVSAASVSASGNIDGGNLRTGGLISATGNATAGNVLTGGVVSATGNVTGGNITTAGQVSATGNATAGNVLTGGVVSATGNVTGGNVLTAGVVSAGGNITGANVNTAGSVSATGNVSAGNVNTDSIVGATVTITASSDIVLAATGNIDAGNVNILNVADPVNNQDAATKAYVDSVAQGLDIKASCLAATTGNLDAATGGTVSYDNGTSGVGATLTTTGTFSTIDTVDITTVGTRILVKNEANAAWNGIYTYANTTTIIRSTDFDNGSPSGEIPGAFTFIEDGAVNADAGFVCTTNAPVTVGTTNITFTQFSGAGTYTAGNALSLSGTTFNVNIDSSGNATVGINGSNELYIPTGAKITNPNITAATGTSVSVTGNIDGGNLRTGGLITATGNIDGGNLRTAGLITATGNVTGGNVLTSGLVSATGNIDGGNVITAGVVSAASVSASGNIDGGNLRTGGLISATGNATAGNLVTGGVVDATGNVTGGNITTAGQVSATGNATAGNVLTGGVVSATGNVTGGNVLTAGVVSAGGNVTGGNVITAGAVSAASVSASGNIDGGNLRTGGLISATGNATAGNVLTGGVVSATGNVAGGNVTTAGVVSAAGTITGGNLVTAGNGNIGNIRISGDDITGTNGVVTFNDASADVDFRFEGATDTNLLFLDGGTDTVNIGTGTPVTGAKLQIDATDSMIVPVGNTAQRPGSGAVGMFRFNTNDDALEVYTSAGWEAVGVPAFTVIVDDQFNGDGSTVQFTLTNESTTAATLVFINGVEQIPTTAYSVSGNVLTFTEAPADTDVIDTRTLTTTTTVTGIRNVSGNAAIDVNDTNDNIVLTGNVIPAANITYNLGSDTARFNELFLAGGTITLGNTVLKNTTGNSIGFFGPDGTTPATIDAASVDTTQIASGTSSLAVIASGGNIRANVAGQTEMTISPGLVAITGNLSVTGNATLSGNILGDRIQNGTTTIDIQTPNGNANITVGGTSNVAVFATTGAYITGVASVSGNVTGGNILTGGLVSATGTVTGSTFVGAVASGTTVSAAGNITGGNILTGGIVSAAGNITGGNLSGTAIAGTLSTAAQTNITSVGTLTSLSVSGNVQGGNLRTAGLVSATGTVTGSTFVGAVASSTTVSATGNITGGNILTGGLISAASTVTGTTFIGIANQAKYADLAEMYVADMDYNPGTVLSFGGVEEVTLSSTAADDRVAGVVSTNPSYLMNSALEGEHTVALALTGRVPTRVTGRVRKGDMMVSNGDGTARAEPSPRIGTVIGKALEDFDGETGTIEVVIGRL